LHFEVEGFELKADNDEEKNGHDWDLFLVRTEIYHNIKNESELAKIMGKWLTDAYDIEPVANIDLPNF